MRTKTTKLSELDVVYIWQANWYSKRDWNVASMRSDSVQARFEPNRFGTIKFVGHPDPALADSLVI